MWNQLFDHFDALLFEQTFLKNAKLINKILLKKIWFWIQIIIKFNNYIPKIPI